MNDPKQPIYDAMNFLGSAMPHYKPKDSEVIISAYEKVCGIEDKRTQQIFIEVIERLRIRNATIERVIEAWLTSADKLRAACQMIGEPK